MNQKMKKDLFENDSSDDDSSSSPSSSDESGKHANDKDQSSSSSSSDNEDKAKLTVNKKYAKDYQTRKQQEELRQIAQQRRDNGLNSDGEESSSDEEEDEDAELLTDSVNLQFLKTMKALKNKESSIYDPSSRFFDENDDVPSGDDGDGKRKHKPKKFKDVLRDQILEDMEEENEPSKEGDDMDPKSKSKFAYDQQQEELRKALVNESNAKESSDNEGDDWMVIKKRNSTIDARTSDRIQEEFHELEQLNGKNVGSTFSDPRGEVKDGEQFLISFMKNKKWIDKDGGKFDVDDDEESIEADRADDFEAKYNFRFEQAEAETAASGASHSIQTYARGQTMNTIRRQDVTRKEKRQARKDRKEAERKAKEEQLKRLKNAKKQEIEQKLSQVKKVLGSVDATEIDEAAIMKMLEGDYDPEKLEKAMQEVYGEDFYAKQDAEWKSDMDVRQALEVDEEAVGVVGHDDVDGGLYDHDDHENEDEDDSGWQEGQNDDNEDEEYVGGDDDPNASGLEKKIKGKLEEELYKLDYEDIVAGMPTRFKYRTVEPNDYGLTTQEILLARDTTLKQFVSLKKMAPYNDQGEFNAGSKKRRRFREMLKQDLEEELEAEEKEEENLKEPIDSNTEQSGEGKKKRRRLKKGKKKDREMADETKLGGQNGGDNIDQMDDSELKGVEESETAKKRRRKNGKNDGSATELLEIKQAPVLKSSIHDDGLPSKKKRTKKNKKKAVAGLPKSRLASYGL